MIVLVKSFKHLKKKKTLLNYIKEHYLEILLRITYWFLSLIICLIISYFFSDQLIYKIGEPLQKLIETKIPSQIPVEFLEINRVDFIGNPLTFEKIENKNHFIYTKLTEAFLTHLRVSLYLALLLSFPVLLIQIWFFLSPALYKYEKKALNKVFILSILFFLGGGFISYNFFLPRVWGFFIEFGSSGETGIELNLQAKIGEYLDLFIQFGLVLGLYFQIPLLAYFLVQSEILSWSTLIVHRRKSIILGCIIATLFSPPDLFSQLALFFPLLLLYESIIILYLYQYSKKCIICLK